MVAAAVLAAAAWAAVLLAAGAWWLGESVGELLLRPQLWWATAASFAANHALRFARWHWMLRAEGFHVPARRSFAVFMAGLALLPTPGKAGVAVRSLLLKRDGVPANVTLAMYFAERLCDFLGLVVLAALLVPGNASRRWFAALAAAIVVMLLVRASPRLVAMLRSRVSRPRLVAALEWSALFAGHCARLAADRRFWPWVAIGLAANLATAALLVYLIQALAFAIEGSIAAGVVAVSHLTGSLSMMPGGLGGFEVAMLGQLHLLDVPAAAALGAVAFVRVATLWGSMAAGLAALALAVRPGRGGKQLNPL